MSWNGTLMRVLRRRWREGFLFALALLCASAPPHLVSHPGATDETGGHSRSDGSYHFHSGPLAGTNFPSWAAAREAQPSIATGTASGTVRIASFNIRIFSNRSRNDTKLEKIAGVLAQYDLVAIQELRDAQVLNRTTNFLTRLTGAQWRYEVSPPVGRGVKELYAFLYRTDRVLVKTPGKIITNEARNFIRPPYYATFRSGYFDFTLLTIHALYKEPNAPERKLEFDALARVFTSLQHADPHEHDLILLGDFNDHPTNSRIAAIREIQNISFLFNNPVRTTISESSLYDNLWFQTNYVTEFTGEHGVDMFDERLFGTNKPAASLEVSDHRPVWAVFRTDKDDD
jgi:endonuclease/exonuclease/phosphatase family metal-dependent hydrolase